LFSFGDSLTRDLKRWQELFSRSRYFCHEAGTPRTPVATRQEYPTILVEMVLNLVRSGLTYLNSELEK
jgi:hypothetical protein